jgi:hypothetical protein
MGPLKSYSRRTAKSPCLAGFPPLSVAGGLPPHTLCGGVYYMVYRNQSCLHCFPLYVHVYCKMAYFDGVFFKGHNFTFLMDCPQTSKIKLTTHFLWANRNPWSAKKIMFSQNARGCQSVKIVHLKNLALYEIHACTYIQYVHVHVDTLRLVDSTYWYSLMTLPLLVSSLSALGTCAPLYAGGWVSACKHWLSLARNLSDRDTIGIVLINEVSWFVGIRGDRWCPVERSRWPHCNGA